jgi:hypothetical protein
MLPQTYVPGNAAKRDRVAPDYVFPYLDANKLAHVGGVLDILMLDVTRVDCILGYDKGRVMRVKGTKVSIKCSWPDGDLDVWQQMPPGRIGLVVWMHPGPTTLGRKPKGSSVAPAAATVPTAAAPAPAPMLVASSAPEAHLADLFVNPYMPIPNTSQQQQQQQQQQMLPHLDTLLSSLQQQQQPPPPPPSRVDVLKQCLELMKHGWDDTALSADDKYKVFKKLSTMPLEELQMHQIFLIHAEEKPAEILAMLRDLIQY